MNNRPFRVEGLDLNEGTKGFKEGQLVLYEGTFGFEIGKIKKLKGKSRAYVWYHSGDTAALTDLKLLNPIVNDYCIEDLIKKRSKNEKTLSN
jgi:hypothetical protein